MKINLIRIGNSKGVRIPASIIKACGFGEQVEMRIDNGVVILAPAGKNREGWDAAFQRMAANGDDEALLPETQTNVFDDEDWAW